MRLGIVHPGSMGVTVGMAAAARGEVLWAGEGRSAATKARASEAAFTDVGTLVELATAADAVISLVPPAAAEDCATRLADAGFTGIYVDANAIAPDRACRLEEIIEHAGGLFVDGGVIGPPARQSGTTRLYLSGAEASAVADLFSGSPLEAIPLGSQAGTASALKMAFAAYTKGSGALLIAIRALAEHHHLTEALLAEWGRSLPDLPDRADATLRRSPRKAWRFAGEMAEIASTFRAAGLPGEFHDAAAVIFRRIGPERPEEADATDILRLILADEPPSQAS